KNAHAFSDAVECLPVEARVVVLRLDDDAGVRELEGRIGERDRHRSRRANDAHDDDDRDEADQGAADRRDDPTDRIGREEERARPAEQDEPDQLRRVRLAYARGQCEPPCPHEVVGFVLHLDENLVIHPRRRLSRSEMATHAILSLTQSTDELLVALDAARDLVRKGHDVWLHGVRGTEDIATAHGIPFHGVEAEDVAGLIDALAEDADSVLLTDLLTTLNALGGKKDALEQVRAQKK